MSVHGDNVGVPTYRVAWRLPRQRRWAACVFVINEGEKVRRQLRAMTAAGAAVDLIVADGGSTDG